MINEEEYLYRRGWSKAYIGPFKNKWFKENSHGNFDLESAISLQLNQDAELRDFIDHHRPKVSSEK